MRVHPRYEAERKRQVERDFAVHKIAAAVRPVCPDHWPDHYRSQVANEFAERFMREWEAAHPRGVRCAVLADAIARAERQQEIQAYGGQIGGCYHGD